jgi:L-ascorbate metabolism protein UlaG (beta-lactamase superfamily)
MTERPIITYLGQSGFFIECSVSKVLIDPQNKKSGDRDGDIVYCTHRHMDHVGGVDTFLTRNPDAILIGNEQVTVKYSKWGERTKTVKHGDSLEYKECVFEITNLRHGVFSKEMNSAVVLRIGEFSFAHCGDAISLEGFPPSTVDILAIPISGAFTLSPKKAVEIVMNLQKPLPTIVPMHWLIRNPKSFCKKLKDLRPNVNCIVPSDGELLKGYH